LKKRLVTKPLSNKVRNIRYSCNKNAKIHEKNLKLFENASVISSKTSMVEEKAGKHLFGHLNILSRIYLTLEDTSSLFSPPTNRRLLNLSLKTASSSPSGRIVK
jgi:hypothetical protein